MEADLAAEAARDLDVGTAGPAPAGATAGDAWRWGVAEAFTIIEDTAASSERVRRAAGALSGTITSAQLPPLRRWMAGMIAGELLADRLYDYAAAQAVYQLADNAAQPGSGRRTRPVAADSRRSIR
jgi:hypothetical protein